MARTIASWARLAAVLLWTGANAQSSNSDPEDLVVNGYNFVDQLIGSSNGGNVFAGASLPYGLAKAVSDSLSGSNQGGFVDDNSMISGFSGVHDSGTGGNPSLGNFPLFPYASCINNTVDGCTFNKDQRAIHYKPGSVVAQPGYFKIELDSGIVADMTVAQHTSLYRFQLPSGSSGNPLILLDLTDLSDSRQDNATIDVDADTGRLTGNGRFLPSFGTGNYVLYFCADFSGADIFDNGIYVNSRGSSDLKTLTVNRGINSIPLPAGGFVRFGTPSDNTILARVGISFMSTDQACSNAEAEIPTFNFDAVRSAAESEWKTKLSPIRINRKGVSDGFVKNFYSGVYRTMINPQNYTGENPLWQSTEPYWDSFYCIWDLFRSTLPFLTIVDTPAVESMVRSLIDTYRHLGWYPDCRMSLSMGYTQGGSNADNVIADAFVKGLAGGIDFADAYAGMVQDAQQEPFFWSVEGRGGLTSWHDLGYIPVQDFDPLGFGTMTRSISRTLEYSYNDFCISQVAAKYGASGSVKAYQQQSGNWRNLFKPDQTSYKLGTNISTGFTGFFQPKWLNETWGFQDPLECSNIDHTGSICSLQDNGAETFESSIWEYSFFVPHDQASLIRTLGGPSKFVQRLNYLHDQKITYIGNEPAFLTVFQYHYAGRPGLSAMRSHFYIPKYFEPRPGGLPGNDDSGAMGSFLAFSMLGLFPNPGQDVYLITPPYFSEVQVKSPVTGKTATVRNINFDPTYKAIYIQNATLNGKPYTKNWIDHSFFTGGKTLELTLGTKESAWGTKAADLPPSLGLGPATQKRDFDEPFL